MNVERVRFDIKREGYFEVCLRFYFDQGEHGWGVFIPVAIFVLVFRRVNVGSVVRVIYYLLSVGSDLWAVRDEAFRRRYVFPTVGDCLRNLVFFVMSR